MENKVWIFFYLKIFSKKETFLEKMVEKIFGGLDHFLGEESS